jgi:SAM-dependent methyltransferase
MTAAESFNILFTAVARSATLRRIWRFVYGPDYPEEADPFSFVTLTDLRRIAAELGVGRGQTVLDLACGRGGPGLWIAQETGASLVGVDFSHVAVEHAQQRAAQLGLSGCARFRVGDAATTGLYDASVDAAMSVDSFWLFPDKLGASTEVARILRPGGRFVFTTWEFDLTPPGWPPQLSHHRDLLHEAGFILETYEETPDWRRRQLAVYAGILAADTELMAELGETASRDIIAEARQVPALLGQSRRVLITTRRPWHSYGSLIGTGSFEIWRRHRDSNPKACTLVAFNQDAASKSNSQRLLAGPPT